MRNRSMSSAKLGGMGQTHAEREVEIGRKFLEADDPNSASYHFLAAVELEPEKAEHHFWLGRSYCVEKNFQNAEKPLRDALRIEPNYAEALVLLGECVVASGHLASAEYYFQLSRELDQQKSDLFRKGYSFRGLGRFTEAESCFREAVRLNPNESTYHWWLSICLRDQSRFSDQEQCLRDVILLDPDAAHCHFWLGLSLEDQGRSSEAEACFRKAIELRPDIGKYHHWLGVILHGLGRFVESERSGREAVDISPEIAEYHYWLGRAMQSQRSFVRATASFREAVRLDPQNAVYSQYLGVSQHPDSLALANSDSDFGRPKSFVEFLLQGQFWLENSHWNVAGKSSFLEGLYEASSFWADPASVLFEDYEVGDEFLDETLARAELLAKSLDLQPVMPIFLETSELSIAMTIEGPFLRAWVGKDHIGVAVAVNLNTWKLHYPPGDRDGAFAVGAALNWFLDRSLAHQNHPHFRDDEGNTWKVSSGFYDDIKSIFTGKYSQPPIAHRVRGHIRTLTEREPTDESRDNAPSYIRRHMSPSDTWVRGYNKGDENSSKQLATRLEKFSSLADFLATAPRA